jgi:uncharacterized oligopeptide transporter (OPT) family protein
VGITDKAQHRPKPQWEDGRMWIGHGRRHRPFAHIFVLAAGALIAATLAPRSGAAKFNEQTLYRFCQQSSCADGAFPYGGLIMDGAGNLYGITAGGGIFAGLLNGHGVVFALNASLTAHGQRAWQR